jgi:hypothetical protein
LPIILNLTYLYNGVAVGRVALGPLDSFFLATHVEQPEGDDRLDGLVDSAAADARRTFP